MGFEPSPQITPALWNQIKALNITAQGGWIIGTIHFWLKMVRKDDAGGTKWELVDWDPTPHTLMPRAPLDPPVWVDIQNGALDTRTNTISKGGHTYRIVCIKNVTTGGLKSTIEPYP